MPAKSRLVIIAKYDVCDKTSSLPEKFGEVNVCKICFMKVNNPFRKPHYDKHEDATVHRCKALEAVHKQNFPRSVVSAINGYVAYYIRFFLAVCVLYCKRGTAFKYEA